MADAPFIKFYPSDFLAGTSGLSPAERGVYITLLCLIYEADGPVALNEARLARRCGAPKNIFSRILEALVLEGKLTLEGGYLSNKRAEKALIDRQVRVQNSTMAASQKWKRQKQKTQQNQRPIDAGAPATQCVSDAIPEPEPDIEKTEANASAKKRGRTGATSLPDDWQPNTHLIAFAIDDGLTESEAFREADKFRDYWHAKRGVAAGRKSDWDATWRNWVRNAADHRQRRHGGPMAGNQNAGRSGQGHGLVGAYLRREVG